MKRGKKFKRQSSKSSRLARQQEKVLDFRRTASVAVTLVGLVGALIFLGSSITGMQSAVKNIQIV